MRDPSHSVTLLPTSAGTCLLLRAGVPGSPPCPECLKSRVREAGFGLGTPGTVAPDTLPPGIRSALEGGKSFCATVILIRGETATSHHLLPVPNCPGCAALQAAPPAGLLPAELLRDPLLGVMSSVQAMEPTRESSLGCHSASARVHLPDPADLEVASGAGLSGEYALQAVVGEAIERYAAFRPVHARIRQCSWSDIRSESCDISLLRPFSYHQRKQAGYGLILPSSKVGWLEGRLVSTDVGTFLPASLIFMSRSWNADELRFNMMLSHGLSAHSSRDQALDNALFELYERYQVTRSWHLDDYGAAFPVGDLPEGASALAEGAMQKGVQVYLHNLAPASGVPVVLVALYSRKEGRVAVGTAARGSVQEAAQKALTEACMVWQSHDPSDGDSLPPKLPPIAGAQSHAQYYRGQGRAARFVRRLERCALRRLDLMGGAAAGGIRAAVTSVAPNASWFDITPPDCAACGQHVIKVVAPGLPLFGFGAVGTPFNYLRFSALPPRRVPHPFS